MSFIYVFPGFLRVLESFGKLWKLIIPLSRTRKVFEKRGFFKWLWKRFGACLGKFLNVLKWPYLSSVSNIVNVMFVHFTTYNV